MSEKRQSADEYDSTPLSTALDRVGQPYPVTSRWRSSSEADKELQLRDLWDIWARRRGLVKITVIACLMIGTMVCLVSTRRYRATAELQVGRETENSLGMQSYGIQEPSSDSLTENITLQTQSGILQSDTLALQVINDLALESTVDYRPKFIALNRLIQRLNLSAPPDPPGTLLEDSPQRRIHALTVFHKNLDVKPIAGTRLIEISYLDPNPKLAADVVNQLARRLVDYNFHIRHQATTQTTEWLAGQMSDLREQSEHLQAKVAQLQRDSGVFDLGETDASGREQVYSSVLDKLQQATTALSQAQANRIAKAAIYQTVSSGDPDAISQLSGNSIFASSSSGLDSSLSLIQSMRMQQSTLRGQLGELSAKFGNAYPKVAELRAGLDALGNSIHEESQRLKERAKNDFEVAQQVEGNARNIYAEQKQQATVVNDKTIEYMIARKEAESSRNLYESLFHQLKQSGVLAGFRANNISLVDPARIPAKPAKPQRLLVMLAAMGGGLFLGLCGAIARDRLDTRIHGLTTVESELGQVPLAVLPFYKTTPLTISKTATPLIESQPAEDIPLRGTVLRFSPKRAASQPRVTARRSEIAAIDRPFSAYVEAVRTLRTSLLLTKGRRAPKVILITSSMPGEGKSMISTNLAAILAKQGRSVLLVEADLRHPNIHVALNVSNRAGLSSLLTLAEGDGGQTFEKLARSITLPIADIPHLFCVPSGATSDGPAELLSSDRMLHALQIWRNEFDYIIVDGAPVLPITDSVVLSGLVDFTLLVARHGFIEQAALRHAYNLLGLRTGYANIGIVLNAVQGTSGSASYAVQYGYEPSQDDVPSRRSV